MIGHVLKAVRCLHRIFQFLLILCFSLFLNIQWIVYSMRKSWEKKVNLYAMPVPSVLLNAFGNAGSHTIAWSEHVWEPELSVLT